MNGNCITRRCMDDIDLLRSNGARWMLCVLQGKHARLRIHTLAWILCQNIQSWIILPGRVDNDNIVIGVGVKSGHIQSRVVSRGGIGNIAAVGHVEVVWTAEELIGEVL